MLAVFVGLGLFFTGASFRGVVQRRLVTELEDVTGGKVEITRIEWNLSRLRLVIDGLTIHGLESSTDAPLAHVDRIAANLRIVSFLSREMSFNSLVFDHLNVNLIVYPDGHTNQPTPHTRVNRGRQGPLDPLFDIAIRRFEVKNSALQLNQQRIPLDLMASDLVANIGYEHSPACYAGNISVGKFDTHFKDDRPFASSADIKFRLFRNALEVTSARITSERSELTLNGTLGDFFNPHIQLSYNARIDLRQVGAVSRQLSLQDGLLQIDGHGQYHDGQMAANGKMQLLNAAWNTAALHVSGVSGSAAFTLDQDRLDVTHVVANALGGTATGQWTVTHWNAARREHEAGLANASREAHSIAAREQNARARFELRGLQVERISELFATQRLPLKDLHANGIVDGTAELTWAGSPKSAQLHLDLQAAPSPNPGSNVPLTAHVEGTYDFRTASMQIGLGELHTPSNHLTLTGLVSEKALDLSVGASTADLGELEPLLEANGAGKLPVELAGEGSFQGIIQGRLAMPSIAGHLKLTDFTTVFRPRPTTAPEPEIVKALHRKRRSTPEKPQPVVVGKPVRFHWDSFDGYVSYGEDAAAVRGAVLRSGSARIEIAASTSLQNGGFTDASVFHATSQIRQARVEDAQALLGLSFPMTGTLNLEMQLNGTRLNPQGTGKVSISDGTAFGEPLQSLATTIAFSGREARFTDLHMVSGVAKAQGSGSINVITEEFNFDVQGAGIDLLRFPVLQTSKVKLTGVAGFVAKGSGTFSSPSLAGQIHISNISLGGKREGDLEIQATTVGEDLKLTAASHFVTATLTASGRIHLRADLASDITAEFRNVNLQPFLVGFARGHSSIDGSVHATGSLLHPTQFEARLEIPRYESQVETVLLHNSGPIVATYKNGTATLEAFRLVGDDTDVTSSGTVRLVDHQAMEMRADGQLNLKLLQSFDPQIVSYGKTSIGVQVGGTLSNPELRGRITIDHAGISYVDLPNGLSDLNGTLVFNEDRLQVEKLTAHTGGGDLAIAGFITYGRNVSFNLTATGKDVRIRYPEGVSANGDASLRLAGTLQNATLTGDVVVNKFGLNPRFDFAYYLTRSKQVVTTPNPDSPLNNLHFDVRVVSTPELQLQTSLAKITGDVDLRLRGTAMRPVVLGRISIVEGNVTFNGTKYRLDRGDILFTNPTKIEPVLDLEASARVSDYDISIGLHGTVDKLNTTYRSDPPLPTADVFALLAFGRTTDQAYAAPQQSNAFTESASSAVLGSALNAAVSSRVQKLFGVSRIKIDPEVGGAENNPNARITVEQQVSGNITLTYITNLAQSAQQVIQFQYNVNRNISIVGVRDEYGVVGFEVQFRQRRR